MNDDEGDRVFRRRPRAHRSLRHGTMIMKSDPNFCAGSVCVELGEGGVTAGPETAVATEKR